MVVVGKRHDMRGAIHHEDYHDRPGSREERFQVHGVDAAGQVIVRKKLRRSELLRFFDGLAPCLVGIEACATAHHWARDSRWGTRCG